MTPSPCNTYHCAAPHHAAPHCVAPCSTHQHCVAPHHALPIMIVPITVLHQVPCCPIYHAPPCCTSLLLLSRCAIMCLLHLTVDAVPMCLQHHCCCPIITYNNPTSIIALLSHLPCCHTTPCILGSLYHQQCSHFGTLFQTCLLVLLHVIAVVMPLPLL